MIELAFKEANRAINVLLIANVFLLLIENARAARSTLDVAITFRLGKATMSDR